MPYWRLFYHVVWGTKHRLALIDPVWEEDLYGYIRGKATALGCSPHAIGGMPDHIHVAISVPPKLSVATLVGQLKGASSHHVNKTYTDGSFLWQAEYGVFSFSEKALASITGYINNQKRHHAANTLNLAMENISPDGLEH
jgi:REP-associated tyrosine transposase